MAALTDRQRDELNKAILNYLESQQFDQSAAAFRSETSIEAPPDNRLDGLLEKKWTAVIRLRKKIMDLEAQVEHLQEEIKTAPSRRTTGVVDWVPKLPPRHTLTGHRSPITRVAFHPKFSLLATASQDNTIKIWDWETGEFERTLKGHTRDVKDVDFDAEGLRLVSASSDLTIKIWDTDSWDKQGYSGKTLHGHDHIVSSARFMNSGDFIVSASRDKTIKIWEVATGFCTRTIPNAHDEWVRWVVPSDDDRLLLSCSNDHRAKIWDYKTGNLKTELRGHDNAVEIAVFAPLNAYQYIGALVGIADKPLEHGQYILTGGRDNLIVIWDGIAGQKLRTFTGHDGWIRGLVFHPTGKFLISAADDKHMRIWDLASGRCTKTIQAHEHFIQSIEWGKQVIGAPNSDGAGPSSDQDKAKRVNVIATGSVDLTVKIWTP